MVSQRKSKIVSGIRKGEKLVFQNECNCIYEDKILESAIIEECSRRGIKPNESYKVYMYRGYAGISIKHEKVSIHRIIGKYMVGFDFPPNIIVHHIDKNKLNNSVSNLQVMRIGLHSKEHCIYQYVDKEKLRENALLATEKVKRNDVTKEEVKKTS